MEYDLVFEHDVSVVEFGGKRLARLTIRKHRAKQLLLRGGEYIRVRIEKDGKDSIFERKVSVAKSPTGRTLKVTIPKENADYLNLRNGDSVKVYIKVLER